MPRNGDSPASRIGLGLFWFLTFIPLAYLKFGGRVRAWLYWLMDRPMIVRWVDSQGAKMRAAHEEVWAAESAMRYPWIQDSAFRSRMLELLGQPVSDASRVPERSEPAHMPPRTRLRRARRHAIKQAMLGAIPFWTGSFAAIGINATVFTIFGGNYLSWYLDAGPLIALVFGLVSIVSQLDDKTGLISADPVQYVQELLLISVEWQVAAAASLGRPRSDSELRDHGDPDAGILYSWTRLQLFDSVVSIWFHAIFVATFTVWSLLVAPLQYWVNLFVGAPIRDALASTQTAWLRKEEEQGETKITLFHARSRDSQGAADVQLALTSKPVTATVIMGAGLLWCIQFIWG